MSLNLPKIIKNQSSYPSTVHEMKSHCCREDGAEMHTMFTSEQYLKELTLFCLMCNTAMHRAY